MTRIREEEEVKNCDSENDKSENMSDPWKASADRDIAERATIRQVTSSLLVLAERQRADYYVRDGILYTVTISI